jgi:DNA-binding NtrC family response regulator
MSFTQDRRRILVIDDEHVVAESLALIFSRHGFEVSVAHSAEDAIEVIATEEPATAFIDVMLPGMDGIEFAKVLKSNWPKCRIVLMSGHPGAAELLQRAQNEGRTLVILAKPVDPNRFLEIASRGSGGDGGGAAEPD